MAEIIFRKLSLLKNCKETIQIDPIYWRMQAEVVLPNDHIIKEAQEKAKSIKEVCIAFYVDQKTGKERVLIKSNLEGIYKNFYIFNAAYNTRKKEDYLVSIDHNGRTWMYASLMYVPGEIYF